MKLTTRQAEVMENIPRITSDGSRHDPIYRLEEKNVSLQVRSLIDFGLIETVDGRLRKVERGALSRKTRIDATSTIAEMRALLGSVEPRTTKR